MPKKIKDDFIMDYNLPGKQPCKFCKKTKSSNYRNDFEIDNVTGGTITIACCKVCFDKLQNSTEGTITSRGIDISK